jgi:hypothetical protein
MAPHASRLKAFAHNLLHQFVLGQHTTRIGIVGFGTHARTLSPIGVDATTLHAALSTYT